MLNEFDLTPDPKVLIALTHTPIQPLDALCELIDNAIDSFEVAKLQGTPIEHPLVIIDLPKTSELQRDEGIIRIRDNGVGLSRDKAEKAIRAGFSGNNPYDSLGLFGMGFNIATGKLGRVTRLFTAEEYEHQAIEVKIDLENIVRSGSYQVPFQVVDKPQDFGHGTIVEISNWWPDGNANSGFIKKLVQYGLPTVRSEIGRRYATILKERQVRITINGELCLPFEHCVWDDSRYVERRGHGQISAVYRFNETIGTQKRCISCTAIVPPGSTDCPECHQSSFRTVEERIRGWVGIQRFDHSTDFGIDLIRNGRAIRIAEKSAFFEYIDEFKKVTKDYPIDQQYGRIVGEVHLNHVPVDFLKQDFQRSSAEWQRVMSYLRGDSSLQPNQPGADANQSVVFKLYQGYRRVRNFGKADMYMGYWDENSNRPERISRDVEQEYYSKFRKREPGYYDDAEWWKMVEAADKKPLEELVECPDCGSQNLKGHEVCAICNAVIIGKECINSDCKKIIAKSSESCVHCGQSQNLDLQGTWTCLVCGRKNNPNRDICISCQEPKGTDNTTSKEYLIDNSHKVDELSFPGCSILLADGSYSPSIDVISYSTQNPIIPNQTSRSVPLITFKSDKIEIFIDKSHPIFRNAQVRPEELIAMEVALFLYDSNRRLTGPQYRYQHSLPNLTWALLEARWGNILDDSPDKIKSDIQQFFDEIRLRLPEVLNGLSEDIFNDLTEDQVKNLAHNLLTRGEDIGNLAIMKLNGKYLVYVEEALLIELVKQMPARFFDGNVWADSFSNIDLPTVALQEAQRRIKASYISCLEDIASFLQYNSADPLISKRSRMALQFLRQKVVY